MKNKQIITVGKQSRRDYRSIVSQKFIQSPENNGYLLQAYPHQGIHINRNDGYHPLFNPRMGIHKIYNTGKYSPNRQNYVKPLRGFWKVWGERFSIDMNALRAKRIFVT